MGMDEDHFLLLMWNLTISMGNFLVGEEEFKRLEEKRVIWEKKWIIERNFGD